ncbi:hypothetical protein CBS147321_6783 [Aspergillus niger]|nr:hypothetical protein CBS133816_4350 [Aspergillus niger]KAI2847990.1 hypothetical protein CBS11350_2931 [Aspergillus niger]KAI2858986.1 hypothetical protein CBS12448_5864 [Aspergillus niger]KAI2917044.1 hypothetical protein CBS147371_4994 [Aspergillus niger]KAI2939269.1 hypothetical protein CBS147321_6783 [Aspergillus niger]
MAAILPLDLLTAIGSYLDEGGTPLAPYTAVCRRWQAAFEPIIYSRKLVIHSDNGGTEPPSSAIPVDKFQALTSGAGAARRAWIRQLRYIINVPYELPDWTSRKHKGYRLQNPVREANNEAFKSAIFKLFQVLSTWDRNNRLYLELGLVGHQPGEEPFTSYCPDAWEYTWDFTNGRTKAIKPYRAYFPENDASMLPYVFCIDTLAFVDLWDTDNGLRDHQIWARAIFQIVQHCPTIMELRIDLDYQTRPDQLEYLQARRQAISDGLTMVPSSLKVFDFTNELEAPWKDMMPALNVLSSDTDSLATTMRDLSINLRSLKLHNTALTLDFLCPIDSDGKPTIPDLHWPHLETIELNYVPCWLPSGKWLTHPTPEYEARIAAIEDWEWIICHSEEGFVDRPVFETEQFHRLFISMGHAAQRMPRLTSIIFQLNSSVHLRFDFRVTTGRNAIATWFSQVDYRPDHRVAAAWNFSEKDLELVDFGQAYSVRFTNWPPN